jgi:hypothetical protein
MSTEVIAAIWGGIVGAIVGAIAGGAVSLCLEYVLTNRRQRIALGMALQNCLDDICGKSAAYWRTSGRNPSFESEIVRDLESLRRKVLRYMLVSNMNNSGDIKRTLRRLQNDTTGGSFSTIARTPDLNVIQNIRETIQLLHVQLKLM